jgi:hypothetical protein
MFKHTQSKLKWFCLFAQHKYREQGGHLNAYEWMQITNQEFNIFQGRMMVHIKANPKMTLDNLVPIITLEDLQLHHFVYPCVDLDDIDDLVYTQDKGEMTSDTLVLVEQVEQELPQKHTQDQGQEKYLEQEKGKTTRDAVLLEKKAKEEPPDEHTQEDGHTEQEVKCSDQEIGVNSKKDECHAKQEREEVVKYSGEENSDNPEIEITLEKPSPDSYDDLFLQAWYETTSFCTEIHENPGFCEIDSRAEPTTSVGQ